MTFHSPRPSSQKPARPWTPTASLSGARRAVLSPSALNSIPLALATLQMQRSPSPRSGRHGRCRARRIGKATAAARLQSAANRAGQHPPLAGRKAGHRGRREIQRLPRHLRLPPHSRPGSRVICPTRPHLDSARRHLPCIALPLTRHPLTVCSLLINVLTK